MKNTIAVVDDPLFARHRATEPHPERPERLSSARAALDTAHLSAKRNTLSPRDVSEEELRRVHTARYVDELGSRAGKVGYFDADTYYGPESVAAARRAAGGVVALTESLLSGTARYGVALVRPPGHHARPDSAMGFCLLNNVAVAAAHALEQGAARIAIVDWDVHHGNGTQEIFYGSPEVLYVSTHQYPFYPGTGARTEVGSGEGTGYTVNIPLSEGADDDVYSAAVDRLVAPILAEYDPDLLLVSAGFDAHHRDPLASMNVSEQGYARMLRRMAGALPRRKEGRVGLILEGGYDLVGLEVSLRATLEALEAEGEDASARAQHLGRHESELSEVLRVQRAFWRLD